MAQPPHFDIDGAIYFVTTRLKDKGSLLTEYEAEVVQRTILELSDWEAKASPTPPVLRRTMPQGRGDFSRPSRIQEFVLYAYVIMPDHVHILLRPLNNRISKTMQLIKGRASRQINAMKEAKASSTHVYGIAPKGEGVPRIKGINKTMGRGDFNRPINFWQKGFLDFTILTERKFKEKFNYIHYNPVKCGLVKKAEDYKYSSAIGYKIECGEVFYKE